ncbi:MAG: PSD1 and planctomycete cytochrome C domain-containing protein [Planctomycetaceae bacterium]
MTLRCIRLTLLGVLLLASTDGVCADGPLFFESQVRPLLKTHCFQCHGEGQELEGGLDARLRRLLVQGGENGSAIVPGSREKSLLFQRIATQEMPPESAELRLNAAEIERIGRWIDAGAHTSQPEPDSLKGGFFVTDEERNRWAFQPPQKKPLPTVRAANRVRNPIDHFVIQRLEGRGLTIASDADKSTWLRRLHIDLNGTPPSPAELSEFLADQRPDAYERLVDRLLADPAYGERWARHWLDAAGYADSEGHTTEDPVRSHSYHYRDYVIRSLNAGKPLNTFVIEQLAGDELIGGRLKNLAADELDKLVATGFLRMAADGTGSGGVDQALASNKSIADTIQIVSSSLLGLTLDCAQCHHHRYDPISQDDYNRVRAIFAPALNWKQWRKPKARLVSLYTDEDRARAKTIEAEAKQIEQERKVQEKKFIEATFVKELAKLSPALREPIRQARETPPDKRTAEQKKLLKENPSVNVTAGSLYLYDRGAADKLKEFTKRAGQVRGKKREERFVRVLTEPLNTEPPPTFVFQRGDHENPGASVQPAEITVLAGDAASVLPNNDDQRPTSGRRLAYARWLTSGRHPLLARVLANRVWRHHFGRGIVQTTADFGTLGVPPTHPDLLDWLAVHLVENGWDLKQLHRLIVTSTTYRQSSQKNPVADQHDPDGRWYSHKPLFRIEAEVLRDAILTISGKWNQRRYGPPVPVMADRVGQFVVGQENLNAGRPGPVLPMHGEEFRRSIYIQMRRSRPLTVLETFDAPRMDPNCCSRSASTVAPQALLLMNNAFVIDRALDTAQRITREVGDDSDAQIDFTWRLLTGREASAWQRAESRAYVRDQVRLFQDRQQAAPQQPAKGKTKGKDKAERDSATHPQLAALASLCQALFSSNQFLYVE